MTTRNQTKAQITGALGHVLDVLSSIAYDIECGNAIDGLDGEDINRCIKILKTAWADTFFAPSTTQTEGD